MPMPHSSLRASIRPFALVLLIGWLLGTQGCASRLNRHSIVNTRAVEIDLVTVREGLFRTKERDFEHPAIISEERMQNILGALEVETSEGKERFLREPAIHPEIVKEAATKLARAFAEADPNSALGVKLIRKEAKLGVFHQKYLTSFMAHIQNGHLILVLSRINWPIPQRMETKKLPEPQPNGSSSPFRVVSGDPLFYAGPKALEIAWRDNRFRKPYRLPGSTKGERRRREVIAQESIPESEGARGTTGTPNGPGGTSIDALSPDALRALADLEDDRRAGKITETAYQRARRELLRKR